MAGPFATSSSLGPAARERLLDASGAAAETGVELAIEGALPRQRAVIKSSPFLSRDTPPVQPIASIALCKSILAPAIVRNSRPGRAGESRGS